MASGATIDLRQASATFQSTYSDELVNKPANYPRAATTTRATGAWGDFIDDFVIACKDAWEDLLANGNLAPDSGTLSLTGDLDATGAVSAGEGVSGTTGTFSGAVSSGSSMTATTLVSAGSYVEINGTRYYSDSGSPNGVLDAPEGSHYTDEDTGYRYRNTSTGSGTTWTSLERVSFSVKGYGNYTGTGRAYFTWQDTTMSTFANTDHLLVLPVGIYVDRITGWAVSGVGSASWVVSFSSSGLNDTVIHNHSSSTAFAADIDVGPSVLGDFLRVSVDPTSAGSDYYVWVEGYRLLG